MKIYAKKGESQQTVLNAGISKEAAGLGSDYVLMQSERPTPEHVADDDGVWVLPVPVQEETES